MNRGKPGRSFVVRAVTVCRSAGLVHSAAAAAECAGAVGLETSSCRRQASELDGAYQVVRHRKPEQDRADFVETADPKLLQAPIAGDGIDALGGSGSQLVDRLRGVGAHPLPPRGDGGTILG